MPFTLLQLSDREEIRDLLNRWALGVDLKDWALFDSCYAKDATVDFREISYQGSTAKGHREYLQSLESSLGKQQHPLSNTIFDELSESEARTRTLTSAAITLLDGVVFFIGAWYHDQLRKTESGWKIVHRRAERVFTHNFPGAFSPAGLSKN